MGSPYDDTGAGQAAGSDPTAAALAKFNGALAIGQALAADLAAVAAASGKSRVADHITSGLQTFQSMSGPITDLEHMAAAIFGMFSTLATAHAASSLHR